MTNESEHEDEEVTIKKSSKHVTRGVMSNFLFNYGPLPIAIVITILLQKNIPDVWDILILSFFYVNAAQIALFFLPPSIPNVLLYKVPEHALKGEFSVIKGIIRYMFSIKLIASFIIWIIYVGIGLSQIFSGGGEILTNRTAISGMTLIFLSPFVILEEIRKIYDFLFQGLKKFMLRFYLALLQKILLLIGYIIIFYGFQNPQEIDLFFAAGLNALILLPSIIVFIVLYLRKFRQHKHIPVRWRQIQTTIKYGMNFTIISSIQLIANTIYPGILDVAGTLEQVVAYDMGNNLVTQSKGAFTMPLAPILVDFYVKNKHRELHRLFKKSTIFTNLLLAFLSGLMFYISELYVLIIYDPEYLPFVPILRVYVLIIYFFNWESNYYGLYSATRLEKRLVIIKIVSFFSTLLVTGILFLIWGFSGLMIGLAIGRLIHVLLFWADTRFLLKRFQLTLWDLFQHFLVIVFLLFVNFLLGNLIGLIPLNWLVIFLQKIAAFIGLNLDYQIPILLNGGIKIFTFLALFLIYVIIFRAITKEDLITLGNANVKIPFKNLLNKILRNKRESVFCVPV
ncbi:MAG: hypothetical protein EU530_10070 [Promethearchaeota archaeon]|nr:MAG: hypothetical protein EU530_10070 [Candidatus Lokiarchaeota archaeon]